MRRTSIAAERRQVVLVVAELKCLRVERRHLAGVAGDPRAHRVQAVEVVGGVELQGETGGRRVGEAGELRGDARAAAAVVGAVATAPSTRMSTAATPLSSSAQPWSGRRPAPALPPPTLPPNCRTAARRRAGAAAARATRTLPAERCASSKPPPTPSPRAGAQEEQGAGSGQLLSAQLKYYVNFSGDFTGVYREESISPRSSWLRLPRGSDWQRRRRAHEGARRGQTEPRPARPARWASTSRGRAARS